MRADRSQQSLLPDTDYGVGARISPRCVLETTPKQSQRGHVYKQVLTAQVNLMPFYSRVDDRLKCKAGRTWKSSGVTTAFLGLFLPERAQGPPQLWTPR